VCHRDFLAATDEERRTGGALWVVTAERGSFILGD
jgi:hypothetical protein